MADIVIRGMEMPKENEILVFDEWHGEIYARSTANLGTKSYEVVPLQDGHGRLIDADDLNDEMALAWEHDEITNAEWTGIREWLNHAPTIVPAEGGGEE